MNNYLPLDGKTVILTGTQNTTGIMKDIEYYGGQALTYPLIEIREVIYVHDAMEMELARSYDWLIFTSQNAVEVFYEKMKRMQLDQWRFQGKVAAVGVKTAEALELLGFRTSFVPSTFSADAFVEEFPKVAGDNPKCLFLRGSLAKSTLRDGLPFRIQEWTIYETVEHQDNAQKLIEVIKQQEDVIVIFASPSAVEVYARYIAPAVGWDQVRIAALGHVTADALAKYNVNIEIQPKTYTMQAVLAEIVKMEER